MKRALTLCVASLALVASRAGAASAPLSWTAPAACPSEAFVRDALIQGTGDERAGEGVRVIVQQRGATWHARLEMPTGERELAGESCQALVAATVAIVSLAHEARAEGNGPDAATAEPPVEVPVVAAPEPLVAASPVASPGVRAPDRAPQSAVPAALEPSLRGLQLAASVLGEVGLLPGPSAGPRLSLGVSDGRWALELAGTLLVPRRATLAGATPSADLRWLGAQVLVCRVARPMLRLCGGGEVGELMGTGSGVGRPETAHGVWVAFVGAAALRAPLGALPVSWETGAAVASALLRPEFGFDDVGVLHRAGQVSARVWLGLGWN